MATMLSSAAPVSVSIDSDLVSLFREAAVIARERGDAASPDELAQARHLLASGSSQDLARAACLVSAWSLPDVPRLADVPDALWGPYLEWLLAAPAAPSPEIAPAVARHLARRCEELADWMDRNLASPAVRAAADAYLGTAFPELQRLPAESLLALQQARGRILQRSQGRAAAAPRTPRPRVGRRLRVAVLHHRFEPRAETFTTLARCAQLDSQRVELHFVALELCGSSLEERCREFAACFHILPQDIASQYHELVALELDALVFGDPLAAHGFPLAHLALLRAAPLQIATDRMTTGLGAIDLLLTGEFDAPAARPRAFAERLALLPGTAFSWDLSPDRPSDSIAWTRATLGVSEESPLVVEIAPTHPTASDITRWRELRRLCPDATLLLVPAPGQEDLLSLRSTLVELGDPQLVLHEPAPFDHATFASLISLADLALGLPGPAASLALEAGVPLLALADETSAASLRTAGLEKAVYADDVARLADVSRLLGDAEARAWLRARFTESAAVLPRFADTYALAADFTELLEAAWDQLCVEGHGRFRRQRQPMRVATPHSLHPGDLHAEALALLAAGRPERAVPCLLSAIQRVGAGAALWFDLARAYHAAGEPGPAVESLEASLRLDEGNAAAWRLLCELAADAGNLDLAREAFDLAAGIAAEHPDLAGLRARIAA